VDRLSTATMSSITPTGTQTASETSQSPSNNGSSGGLGPSSGTNYFFGFLIAFIAFLFVFLSLGLFARRRRMRIMQEFLLYGPDGDFPNITQTEPRMWQPQYTPALQGQLWSEIMPLSTSLVQREEIRKIPIEEPPRPSRLFPPAKTRRQGPQKIQVTEAMNIAVVIELPQAPEALQEAEGIHEYQIGLLQVPWKDNMDENLPET